MVDCDLEATNTNVTGYSTIFQSDGKRVQIGATDTHPVIQAGGSGTSGNLLLNPFQGKVGIGTAIAPLRNLTINATTPVLAFTRDDVENFRIQATSSGIYYDAQKTKANKTTSSDGALMVSPLLALTLFSGTLVANVFYVILFTAK